ARIGVVERRAEGAVDADIGRRVVRRHLSVFGACPGWAGVPEASLAIRILPAGDVESVDVSGTSLPPELVTCLTNTANAITFPSMRSTGVLHVTLRAIRPGF
ncbi:hypothetical protein GW813_04385, partial [bacterium]|nr:hypothetical protein [bacterium]